MGESGEKMDGLVMGLFVLGILCGWSSACYGRRKEEFGGSRMGDGEVENTFGGCLNDGRIIGPEL